MASQVRGIVVAIDGPAGAGKSTISKRVAERLSLIKVDTGAIYRAVALLAAERRLEKPAEIAEVCENLDIQFSEGRVLIDARDVSSAIRTAEISQAASRAAAIPEVRRRLLDLQRRLARAHEKGAVLEGRDIGTVVFPDAEVKIFLTASPEERARRRMRDLERAGAPQSYDEVLREIIERDERDTKRTVSPLRAAADAVVVDTTGRSIDDVVGEIVAIVGTRCRIA